MDLSVDEATMAAHTDRGYRQTPLLDNIDQIVTTSAADQKRSEVEVWLDLIDAALAV